MQIWQNSVFRNSFCSTETVKNFNFYTKQLFFVRPKQLVSLILVAIMLGVSNSILEEDRSVNDTRIKTEILEDFNKEGKIN